MSDLWDEVRARIDAADVDALADVLAGLDDGDRAVLVPHLDGYAPAHAEPEPVVLPPLEPEPLPDLPTSGFFTVGFVMYGDEKPPSDLRGIREHIARQRARQREDQRIEEVDQSTHRRPSPGRGQLASAARRLAEALR